jgi:predicted nucleotidyltransferase
VVSAYLFGSYSEARAHRESDVDVGVLLDRRVFATNPDRFEARLRLIGLLGSALGRGDVDLVILNDAPPGLGARIVTRALRLYCSDAELDHAFVRDVQLRAASPFSTRFPFASVSTRTGRGHLRRTASGENDCCRVADATGSVCASILT